MSQGKKRFRNAVLWVLTVGLAGAAGWALRGADVAPEASPTSSRAADPQGRSAPLPQPVLGDVGQGARADLAEVAARVVPSVVNVYATKVHRPGGQGRLPFFSDPFFRQFFGRSLPGRQLPPQERRERSLGSGVIVSQDGTILTNNHVVEGAEEVRVALSDKRDLEAELVGTDPESDLAVLRIQDRDVKGLPALSFGDSDRMRLGDVVLAVGNPFGVGQTVTMGIVSATGRANVGIVDYEDFIQTDAAINPGNSGGALVNLEGKLVGINTAILSRTGGYQGVGFAIPSSMAEPIMQSLIDHGRVVRGWLGVSIQDIDGDLAEALDIETTSGALVADVVDNSPADEAGLARGDIVVRLDDDEVTSSARLRNLVAARGAGRKVTVHVLRDGRPKPFELTLGEKPKDAAAAAPGPGASGLSGLSLAPLTPQARQRFDIPAQVDTGVLVTGVAPDSAAARAGLRPGDVIVEVNRRPVTSVDEAHRAHDGGGDRVLLLVQRGPMRTFLVLSR